MVADCSNPNLKLFLESIGISFLTELGALFALNFFLFFAWVTFICLIYVYVFFLGGVTFLDLWYIWYMFIFTLVSPLWLGNLLGLSGIMLFIFWPRNPRWFSPWSRWSLRTPIGQCGSWWVWASASCLCWLFTMSPLSWRVRAVSRTWLLRPTICDSRICDRVFVFFPHFAIC